MKVVDKKSLFENLSLLFLPLPKMERGDRG